MKINELIKRNRLKKKKTRPFQGKNLTKLEANVDEYIKNLGDKYISQRMVSANPDYVIEVEYWQDK